MAAKIGILGESVATATGTVTVYTVPADKAARVRILWAAEVGGADTKVNILIGTPGSEINIQHQMNSGVDFWSGGQPEATPDPAGSVLASVQGMYDVANALDIDNLTVGLDWWIGPLPADYFLSTGDTVRMNISTTALLDNLFQVQGVEDDA